MEGKMSFNEWLESELGVTPEYFDENYSGNQKYYNGRTWVSRNAAETFDWYNADNTARELRYAGVDAVVEEK